MGFHLPHKMFSYSCWLVMLEAQGLGSCHVVTSLVDPGGSPQRGRFLLLTTLALYPPTPRPKVGCPQRLIIGFENHFDLILGNKLPKYPIRHNGLKVKKANLKPETVALLLDRSSLEYVQLRSLPQHR